MTTSKKDFYRKCVRCGELAEVRKAVWRCACHVKVSSELRDFISDNMDFPPNFENRPAPLFVLDRMRLLRERVGSRRWRK